MLRFAVVAGLSLLGAVPLWAQTPTPDSAHLGPRTILPHQVNCTDLPVSTMPALAVVIKGGHNADGRQSLVKGDEVVLSAGTDQDIAVGQKFLIRRVQGRPKDFPKKGEGFGAVRTAGWLTVTAVNNTTAIATVDFACDGVAPGDYIEVFTEPVLPATVAPIVAPQFDDRAQVLFGADRRQTFADGDVFSIDRGTAQGVSPGERFAIYRDRHNGLPLAHVADVVVLESGELTSKVVAVMSRGAIWAGDVAVARRAP